MNTDKSTKSASAPDVSPDAEAMAAAGKIAAELNVEHDDTMQANCCVCQRVIPYIAAALTAATMREREACAHQLRCFVTKNECGTDTWMVGRPCECPNCQLWLQLTGNDKPELILRADAIRANLKG